MPLYTPDGRYIIVRERLWRASDPALPSERRQALTNDLMNLRRAKKSALQASDRDRIASFRDQIDAVKRALGERGPVWWDDDAPDENRRLVRNSSYAAWWQETQPTGE